MSRKKDFEKELIEILLSDPTRSMRELSNILKLTRQAIWKKKKALEENNTIWGYSAIVDYSMLKKFIFVMMLKMKRIDDILVNNLIEGLIQKKIELDGIQLIDVYFVNGEFDWIIQFSSKDHITASKYLELIRTYFEDYLFSKPIMIDINFVLMSERKSNPQVRDIFSLVPSTQ